MRHFAPGIAAVACATFDEKAARITEIRHATFWQNIMS